MRERLQTAAPVAKDDDRSLACSLARAEPSSTRVRRALCGRIQRARVRARPPGVAAPDCCGPLAGCVPLAALPPARSRRAAGGGAARAHAHKYVLKINSLSLSLCHWSPFSFVRVIRSRCRHVAVAPLRRRLESGFDLRTRMRAPLRGRPSVRSATADVASIVTWRDRLDVEVDAISSRCFRCRSRSAAYCPPRQNPAAERSLDYSSDEPAAAAAAVAGDGRDALRSADFHGSTGAPAAV